MNKNTAKNVPSLRRGSVVNTIELLWSSLDKFVKFLKKWFINIVHYEQIRLYEAQKKLFASVPKNSKIRKKRMHLARRRKTDINDSSNVLFWDDHFKDRLRIIIDYFLLRLILFFYKEILFSFNISLLPCYFLLLLLFRLQC